MKTLLIFFVAVFAVRAQTMVDGENPALRAVAQSTGGFANNFLKVVAEGTPGNLICSPLSAQVVLAMAAYGAGSRTATQMRSSLLLPSDNEFGQSGYQSLIQTLNNVKGVELRLANKIYTAHGFDVKEPYRQLTASKFLSASQALDFNNPTSAASTINAWCEQQTNNRIKDIITPDSLTGDTRLVLVNAVYFKGKWAKKFDPALTTPRPFHIDTRTMKDVPTMYIHHKFRCGDLSEVNARFIELPYEGKDVSMIIILPNEIDGLQRVQDNLSQVNIAERLRQTYPKDVDLYLPSFKTESTLDLKEPLEKLGMTDMFGNGADFSGIADIPLKVSKVIQKAFIEVNEEGSEAAAVTVLTAVGYSGFITETLIFNVDRPYYYEIRFVHQAVPLFAGIRAA